MQFHIADTFADALARLPAQEQKAAKTSAFDLQLNPAAPGLQFHRIDKSKDPNFWSMRVNRDVRLSVHTGRASFRSRSRGRCLGSIFAVDRGRSRSTTERLTKFGRPPTGSCPRSCRMLMETNR